MNRLSPAVLTAALILMPVAGHADFRIHLPSEIDVGALEIEHNGDAVFDRRVNQTGPVSIRWSLAPDLTPGGTSRSRFMSTENPATANRR
jgi:hypothetical protein